MNGEHLRRAVAEGRTGYELAAAALADEIDDEILSELKTMNVVQHHPTWEKCLKKWATKHQGPARSVLFEAMDNLRW